MAFGHILTLENTDQPTAHGVLWAFVNNPDLRLWLTDDKFYLIAKLAVDAVGEGDPYIRLRLR